MLTTIFFKMSKGYESHTFSINIYRQPDQKIASGFRSTNKIYFNLYPPG